MSALRDIQIIPWIFKYNTRPVVTDIAGTAKRLPWTFEEQTAGLA